MSSLYYFSGMDRRHPESKKYGAYRQTFVKEDTITQVDSVSGSYLLMPKQVFEQIDGFDDDYFMYGEDLDLCYRVKQNGYQVVYYGQASMKMCIRDSANGTGHPNLHCKGCLSNYARR